jgi:poly(A) polymerase
MSVLLPELAAFLDDEEATGGGARRFFRKMDAVDAMMRARGRPLDDVVLWTVLLKEPLDEACNGERDKIRAAGEFLDPVIERVAVPRRIADGVRRIVDAPAGSRGPSSWPPRSTCSRRSCSRRGGRRKRSTRCAQPV